MPFTYNATLLLGTSKTGLALRAALVDTGGTIHATARDVAAGFVEVGAGVYTWVYAGVPDGYRGSAVYYTGTLGGASNFAGVAVLSASPLAPEEWGGLINGAVTEAKITLPAEAPGSPTGALALLMWIAALLGWRKVVKDAATIKTYMPDGTAVKTSSDYSSVGGIDTIEEAV